MTPGERRAAVWLSGIFALRMLGLFMLLPVLALYARDLPGATAPLIGLAVGVYGFSQALFQIPIGLLSDRFGRKRLIIAGLALFAAGSVMAALADTILGVILGRALQGAGAISAAVMALAADLTREEHHTKVMAVIGASIGLSFALSMVLGPLLGAWIGVAGLFWLTAVLALLGMAVVRYRVPQPAHSRTHWDAEPVPAQFRRVLVDSQLLRLDFGIFVLHLLLTASFVAVPLALRDAAGLPAENHWPIYLIALLLSLAVVVPLILLAERRRRLKPVFLVAILSLALAELGLLEFHGSVVEIAVLLCVFFTGFNLLEALLPSLVTKTAPPDARGTALGVYTTSQFLGAFAGGAAGGGLYGAFGPAGVFGFAAAAALTWFGVAATMRNPRYLGSYSLNVGRLDEAEAQHLAIRLAQVRGVAEAVVIAADGVAYLKVDRHALDEPALLAFSTSGAHNSPVSVHSYQQPKEQSPWPEASTKSS